MNPIDEKTKTEVNEIKSKTKHGLISLFSRSILIYLLRALSILLLSRFLDPKDYGVFGILNSWVWAIHLFIPDLSMFTALIHQKVEPSLAQMRNLFGVCLYRSIFIVLFFIIAGSFIIDFHNLDKSTFPMLVVLSFSIFFDGLRTPYRLNLERKLNFKAIVFVEVSETFVMYLVQIISAWMGAGVWSFVLAMVSRTFTGLIFYYLYDRRFYLPIVSMVEIKKLFHYEVMVQLKKIFIGIKGLIIPVVLGTLLSQSELGLVMWSIGIASIPVVLAHNYDRVLFPALSKLQSNLDDFKNVASKGVEYSTLGLGFLFGIIACSATPAIQIFFPEKWGDAIVLLPLCTLALFLAQVRYLLASIMNASGQPKKLLVVEVAAIVLELSLAIPATIYSQGIGYLYALILVEFMMCLYTLKINSKYLRLSTVRRIFAVLVSFVSTYFLLNNFLVSEIENIYLSLGSILTLFPIIFTAILVMIDFSVVQELTNYLKNKKINNKREYN